MNESGMEAKLLDRESVALFDTHNTDWFEVMLLLFLLWKENQSAASEKKVKVKQKMSRKQRTFSLHL